MDDLEKRVELNKSWETSIIRRICIIILTYTFAVLYLRVADTTNPYLGAVVPCAGFFLSTWSLKLIRIKWEKQIEKRK